MVEEFIEMKGHARRELKENHSMNYNLEQVVADLVDNSIDAGAKNIEIMYNEEEYNGHLSFYVVVADDGKGIPDNKISSVMDIGVEREYDEVDLGKFGVGMKKSSLSQAREVTLLSKVNNGKINLRRLSSEVVEEQDSWILIPTLRDHMNTDAIGLAKQKLADRNSGSVIVLEDMHKLKHRIGQGDRKGYLAKEYGHIKEYLSLVFEKYMKGTTLTRSDGSTVHKKINIYFNGTSESHKLETLDPFCKDMQDGSITGTLSKSFEIPVDDGKNVHKVPLTIWITPNKQDRGQDYDNRIDQAARYVGIPGLQGLYIYRNDRLIDFPGWKKILKPEPHLTCDRWEVHFPPNLDEVFQLDPSKREIQLPATVFEELCKIGSTKIRWHSDDAKPELHRKRARMRQGGKDKPKVISTPTITPTTTKATTTPKNTSKVASSGNIGRGFTPEPVQAISEIKIKKLAGSITGQLIVSQREEGDKLKITLNTGHKLYEKFVQAMKDQ